MKKLESKQLEKLQGGIIEISPEQTRGIVCVGTLAAMLDPRSSNSLTYFLSEYYAENCL